MNSNRRPSFSFKGGLGYTSLDQLLNDFNFQSLHEKEYTDEEKEKLINFLEEIDELAEKYLNPKEKCIYYLVIHEKKRTSEIAVILNYNGWRTTQNSIDRLFKILNIYYEFEKIDQEKLRSVIQENFNKQEIRIIELLEKRLTIQQITHKLGRKFDYNKTRILIKNILSKLENLSDECKDYHTFLIDIRKFKDSCKFSEEEDQVEILNEEKRNGRKNFYR